MANSNDASIRALTFQQACTQAADSADTKASAKDVNAKFSANIAANDKQWSFATVVLATGQATDDVYGSSAVQADETFGPYVGTGAKNTFIAYRFTDAS